MSSVFYTIYILPYAGIIKICRTYTNPQEYFVDYDQEVVIQIWALHGNTVYLETTII
ncbi:MAG: hypothetical protein JKX68_04235 [Flavobacteriales bacterium]|nr:hypothetical protein [Flavobacteriales bacterium]